MPTFLSANFTSDQFPSDPNAWTVEQKITVFQDSVLTWQLDIANNMINGGIEQMRHSGFATLSVIFSYFEMIGKYYHGHCQDNLSKEFFRKGFVLIYSQFSSQDVHLNTLYERCRSGLYHVGRTKSGLLISGGFRNAAEIDSNGCWLLNPHIMTKDLIAHFGKYCELVKTDSEIQANFEARFNYDRRS